MSLSTNWTPVNKRAALTLVSSRSAFYLFLAGQQTCKISLYPLPVHCWLSFTRPQGVKPVLFAYSCTSSYPHIHVEASTHIRPKVPARLPAFRYYKYHDYKQSYDLCIRQVPQILAIWRKLFACTDRIAETVDFLPVGSYQKSTPSTRCH